MRIVIKVIKNKNKSMITVKWVTTKREKMSTCRREKKKCESI